MANEQVGLLMGFHWPYSKVILSSLSAESNDKDFRSLKATLILGLDVLDEIDDSAGVAILIVVPADQLDEVVVEGDASGSVEDGGVSVSDEVRGHHLVLGVAEHTLHGSLGSFLHLLLDSIIAGGLGQADGQVDNRHVGYRNTESHTSQLAIECRNDLADSLSGSSGSRNDVLLRATAIAPQFARGTVNGLLGGSGGVDGGHQTLNDFEVVVDDLGQGSKAVGGARRVGDDLGGRVVRFKVYADDEHGRVSTWSRDDDLLGTTLQVTFLSLNGALEASMSGVVFEQVDHVVQADEGVVDGDHRRALLDGRAEDQATDAAKSVDTDLRHVAAINDPAIELPYICYLIKFDSTHGKYKGNISYEDNVIKINDHSIMVFHQKAPCDIPWQKADVQYVIEASGMFTNMEKASGHLASDGVRRVLVTAPSSDVPMLILGVNQDRISSDVKVVSCTSSTLYCLAPIIKLLQDAFGVGEGFVTSIHAMTPSLKPLDGLCIRGK
ncbi:hypothetical protein MSG28_013111 [Choristoneura fumiferana]|uniref:Uncharacterized protein n=1 Tax=Choristoneura fumiferana TaxID=7141 RepID=A0ACC0KSA3_CHOFU|nr:hypothetical protein MSG28_013111 [Choristoneura fumiferana]